MVILPRIEYRTQLTYLIKRDCDNIIIPFRKTFKHKLHMALSIPNNILENQLIYQFRDLWEVQKQSKITNFSIQINDTRLLGAVTNLRLLQLQHREWLRINPLAKWPYEDFMKRFYRSYIPSMLSLCKSSEITF